MKIGIDLDGVAYDFTGAFCRYVNRDPATATKWEFYKDWGHTTEWFLSECKDAIESGRLFRYGDLIPGVRLAFRDLIDMGHEIHLVTDRCSLNPEDTRVIKTATYQWLVENDLEYHSLHFTGEKDKIVKELELDFFLDDKVENYDMVDPHVRFNYLFAQPWNDPATHGVFSKPFRTTVGGWPAFVEQVRLRTNAATAVPTYFDGETGSLEWKVAPGEVRITSETGGAKGQKQARLGSLDPQALLAVAKVAGFGEEKYDRLNYMRGYDWSLTFDAMQRHVLAFWSGQDNDPESGLPHMAHAAWHCLTMLAFLNHGLGTDDRYVKP